MEELENFSDMFILNEIPDRDKDQIVIFDDCDSVLQDKVAVNILKAALDSYDKRTISWLQKGFIDDGLPNSFEFQGNVIFISNMSSDKIDQAVKSRSMTIDLSMSIDDKIENIEQYGRWANLDSHSKSTEKFDKMKFKL